MSDQQLEPALNIANLNDSDSRGFDCAGKAYFVVRLHGKLRVYRNLCPHRQVNLNWQADAFFDSSNSLIQCASHGALFLIETGECVSGPCQGEYLEAIDFEQQGDWLYLRCQVDKIKQ